VLLTRTPLSPKASFDLHVLGLPPAFVLSQDQTLKFDLPILKLLQEEASLAGFDSFSHHVISKDHKGSLGYIVQASQEDLYERPVT
jgi:hypothetical protein